MFSCKGLKSQRLLLRRAFLSVGLCVYLFILSKMVLYHTYQGSTQISQGDLFFAIQSSIPTAVSRNAKSTLKTDSTTITALAQLPESTTLNKQAQLAESLKRIRQKALQQINDPNYMELRFRENPGDGRPPFSSLFDKSSNNVTADISDLLQFAIVGFGKCASTTMRDWLNTHPQIQCYHPHEVLDLMRHDLRQLLSRLYSMPPGTNILRGFKSPVDLSIRHVMQDYYAKYFNKTKLIVGLRHPVHWFESLYNFRIQNMPPDFDLSTFPTPNSLRGHCRPYSHNTCTYKGEFAIFLRQLGKTSMLSNNSPSLLAFEQRLHEVVDVPYLPMDYLPNPVFIFEIRQLQQQQQQQQSSNNNRKNTSADDTFRRDLAKFLNVDYHGFSKTIPHYQPGQDYASINATLQGEKDHYKINICDKQHILVRKVLMRIARTSAAWIQSILLPAAQHDDSIVFTNQPQFEQLIKEWYHDPCVSNINNDETALIGQKILNLLPEQYHLKDSNNVNNNEE